MPKRENPDDAAKAVRQRAKGAAVPRNSNGPDFSRGENQPVLDADMQPVGDPSRLAEAADVTARDDAE